MPTISAPVAVIGAIMVGRDERLVIWDPLSVPEGSESRPEYQHIGMTVIGTSKSTSIRDLGSDREEPTPAVIYTGDEMRPPGLFATLHNGRVTAERITGGGIAR